MDTIWNRTAISTQERLRYVQTLASLRKAYQYAACIADEEVRYTLKRELEVLIEYMRIHTGVANSDQE